MAGTREVQEAKQPDIRKIVDRKEAITQAIKLAQPGDAVIITGKGGEVWMCVAHGKKIPWSDQGIVQEILKT
jgi:UDP-N-acetylmuramoyl-L-alanyl-D-glutamate--2,6-diaminopimelate ligase